MLLKKGIVRRTFFFSALLVSFVTLISFAMMYFVMPGYYLAQKEKTLRHNLNLLTQRLQLTKSVEDCAVLIADFSVTNNVTVLSFDGNERLLPPLSTPFLGMQGDNAVFISDRQQPRPDGNHAYTIQIRNDRVPESPVQGLTIRWAAIQGKEAMSAVGAVGTELVDHVMVSGTLQPIDEARGVILSLIPYVLAMAVMVGLVLSGIYARQISKPILQISEAALRMQRMEPGAVSGIQTRDELGQLSANLDVLYTKLLENIDRLKKEMDQVNRLERSKTEMMRNASHELKTPIAALNGMLEGMLDNVGVYRDKDKYLKECKNQTDRLSYLVSEILGASRVDVADGELERSEVCVDDLVRRAIAENAFQIREKGLRVKQELTPAPLITEPNTLYHAIANLVSNAVRYTPVNGEIRVAIEEEASDRRLFIENECESIAQEELPKLFEPFYTRSYSRDKAKSGTGLGLYIVKRSLEQLEIAYEARITETGFQIRLTI